MLPRSEELPAPSDDFLEIETAKQHGGWHAWQQIPVWRREQLMAHDLHKSRRDVYYRERMSHHARKDKTRDRAFDFDPLESIKKRMGVKY